MMTRKKRFFCFFLSSSFSRSPLTRARGARTDKKEETMVRASVLNDALRSLTAAEKRGKRQVMIRPASKVIVKFLQVMQQHGPFAKARHFPPSRSLFSSLLFSLLSRFERMCVWRMCDAATAALHCFCSSFPPPLRGFARRTAALVAHWRLRAADR
jgi:hypothetical protein